MLDRIVATECIVVDCDRPTMCAAGCCGLVAFGSAAAGSILRLWKARADCVAGDLLREGFDRAMDILVVLDALLVLPTIGAPIGPPEGGTCSRYGA